MNVVQAAETESRATDFQMQKTVNRSSFLLGANATQLVTSEASFTGAGANFEYQYAITPQWAISPQIAQVYGVSSGGKSLYTSLGASADYAITGSYIFGKTEYYSKGSTILKLSTPREPTFSASLGFEQLFLSGSQATYSAPGFTAGVSYSMEVFERLFRGQLKFGQYQNNDKPLTGMMVNVSTYFDL